MSEEAERSILEGETRVLLPLQLPGDVDLSPALVEVLGRARVFVLGCYVVPEQTSPEHARSQFEDDAQASIERVSAVLESADIDVETELVFTPDPAHTIDRVSDNLRIDALLWVEAVERIENILTVVSPGVEYDRVVKCLATVATAGNPAVELIEFADNEADETERDLALDGLVARLEDAGLQAAQLDSESRISTSPREDLEEMAGDYDLVVLAYTAEMSNRQFIDDVRRRVGAPVLIVRTES